MAITQQRHPPGREVIDEIVNDHLPWEKATYEILNSLKTREIAMNDSRHHHSPGKTVTTETGPRLPPEPAKWSKIATPHQLWPRSPPANENGRPQDRATLSAARRGRGGFRARGTWKTPHPGAVRTPAPYVRL